MFTVKGHHSTICDFGAQFLTDLFGRGGLTRVGCRALKAKLRGCRAFWRFLCSLFGVCLLIYSFACLLACLCARVLAFSFVALFAASGLRAALLVRCPRPNFGSMSRQKRPS